MYTIGQLARKYNLSRSTLLYYSSIGLLPASGRNSANYRIYSEADAHRLEQICIYRQAGLPLHTIQQLQAGARNAMEILLETRVHDLNQEIHKLRQQQKSIVRILLDIRAQQNDRPVDWESFMTLFEAAGFSDYDKWKWHREFEMMSPDQHRAFLEASHVPTDKIALLRSWVRKEYDPRGPF